MRVSSRNGALVKEVLSPRPAPCDPRLIWHVAEKEHRQRAAIALAREATCKRREAAQRATATRARKASVPRTAAAAVPAVVAVRGTKPSWNPADVIDAEIVSEESYS